MVSSSVNFIVDLPTRFHRRSEWCQKGVYTTIPFATMAGTMLNSLRDIIKTSACVKKATVKEEEESEQATREAD